MSYHIKNYYIGKPALTAKESLDAKDEETSRRITAKEKQKRALQDFFRDTGGKVTDLRVLRSAMFLSDEIDRAVRGTDDANQYVSWRPYNRFYAEGTEDLFTNVPTGRSPLVMAAPTSSHKDTALVEVGKGNKPLPIEYQAMRRSHLKLVGRQLKEYEQDQVRRLKNASELAIPTTQQQQSSSESTQSIQSRYETSQQNQAKSSQKLIRPRNDNYEPPVVSSDLRVGAYQQYNPLEKQSTTKQKLLRFEGEITERRPDLDYKFEQD